MSGVRDHLQALHDEHGELTAALVVAAATPPEHPLHDRFQWDDAIAGHAHRLDQARGLIRSVRIEYRAPDGARRSVREFVNVARPTGRSYDPTVAVARDPMATAIVLADMAREWRALKRRYGHLDEFLAMVRAEADPDANPGAKAG